VWIIEKDRTFARYSGRLEFVGNAKFKQHIKIYAGIPCFPESDIGLTAKMTANGAARLMTASTTTVIANGRAWQDSPM
jgi:hypothetical protein